MTTQLKISLGATAAVVLAIIVIIAVRRPDERNGGEHQTAGAARTRGEASLLRELDLQAEAAFKQFNELERSSPGGTNHQVFDKINEAFNELGHKAGTGDEKAFQTLVEAAGMKYLQGPATVGLGVAAGDGSEKAVEILVEPKKNDLLLSSVVGALRPAAEKGDTKAIKFLSGVTQDGSARALWFMAASALAKPAGAGNEEAITGLINLLGVESKGVQQQVKTGLKQAALIGNARAQAAVDKMGW